MALQEGLKPLVAYKRPQGSSDFRPLLDAASTLVGETGQMVEVLLVVAGKPKDAAVQSQLAVTAKSTTDAIKQIIQAAEALTFGLKECKEAIEVIQRGIGDLDAAAISATVGLLEAPVGGPSNQQCKEELITLSRDLATATGRLVDSAKESSEVLQSNSEEKKGMQGMSSLLTRLSCVMAMSRIWARQPSPSQASCQRWWRAARGLRGRPRTATRSKRSCSWPRT